MARKKAENIPHGDIPAGTAVALGIRCPKCDNLNHFALDHGAAYRP